MQAVIGSREGVLSDKTRLGEFAEQHGVALTRFAYLLCGDHQLAEDLVQDAFLALHRRFGDMLRVEAPVAYARRVIVNAQISRLRRRASTETVLDLVPDSAVESADCGEQDAMWRELAVLPQRQRAVLVLRYYLDQSDRDIAALLGCREGTVRSLAARAFAVLREHPALRGDTAEEHR